MVVEADTRTFTALGATGTENLITFPTEQLSAMQALALIGGINDTRADPQGILVLREYKNGHVRHDGNGPPHTQTIFTIDLTSADGLFAARNFMINPGDSVVATESPITAARTVFGVIGSLFGLRNQVTN